MLCSSFLLEIQMTILRPLSVALFAAITTHWCHLQIQQEIPQDSSKFRVGLIPRADLAKTFTLGFDRVIADYYWLLFLQYYGDRRSASVDLYHHVPAYLKLIIAIDPHFTRPYWFVAFAIAGDLKQMDEAEHLLNLGIEKNPEDWNLPYIAGFTQYLYAKNEKKASFYYRKASRVKGAPAFLETLAQIMDSQVWSVLKQIRTWDAIYRSTDNAVLADKAKENLRLLWSRVYYNQKVTDTYRKRALSKLQELDLQLLSPQDLSSKTFSDENSK